ncbi:MAG: hypothetical protein GXO83_00455 [Chlorobi bacterium]|nr:hypothetical protein [Chlorobiota bacterium]
MICRRCYRLILLFVIIAGVQSCIKEEFTLPTRVQFLFELTPDPAIDFLEFNGGDILIRNIEFEGYRQTGDDYFFTHRFTPPLSVKISEFTGDSLTFDIPQGIYQKIKVRVKMKGEQENTSESGSETHGGKNHREESRDYPDDNPEPKDMAVMLSGSYHTLRGEKVPLVLVIDNESFEGDAVNSSGTGEIVLTRDKDYEGIFTFDPGYAFQVISRKTLEDAERYSWKGVPTILISEETNDEIYELVLYRLQKSFGLKII